MPRWGINTRFSIQLRAITFWICVATNPLPRWGINTRFQYNYGQSLFRPALLQSRCPDGDPYTITIQLRAITFLDLRCYKAVAPMRHQYTITIQLRGNHFLDLRCYKAVAPMGDQYTIARQLMAIIGVWLAFTLVAIVIYPYCLLVAWRAVSAIHLPR
ncbi:MAG TPA: hypothetical protein VFN95_08680 [Flavitalea sp.]|nr:hypothetical protein [Flavitalea sp.]